MNARKYLTSSWIYKFVKPAIISKEFAFKIDALLQKPHERL
jgi:hypothetical protein